MDRYFAKYRNWRECNNDRLARYGPGLYNLFLTMYFLISYNLIFFQDPLEFKLAAAAIKKIKGQRRPVAIRALAEAKADVKYLSRKNVKANCAVLPSFGLCFEILIRSRNFSSACDLVKSCPETKLFIKEMISVKITTRNS